MGATADPNGVRPQTQPGQLTSGAAEFTPTWSPDGTVLVFHGGNSPSIELFKVPLRFENGSVTPGGPTIQLTTFGDNLLASWGKVRI
jgi:hypothetical protein